MYVHDLNPVLVRFTDQIQLRWYGLAYLGAFAVGAWLLNVLAKRKLWVLPAGAAGDFIAAAAIFGVFIGGRMGSMLWYFPDQHGWGWVTGDPLMLVRVWGGGRADVQCPMSRVDRLNNRGPPHVEGRRSSTDGLLKFRNVIRCGGVDEVLEIRNDGPDAGL